MSKSPIGLVCFGDITQPQNGYTIRVKMLTKQLIAKHGSLDVYQFAYHNDTTSNDGLTIHTFSAQTTTKNIVHRWLNRTIGFDPFAELWTQGKQFRSLWQHRHQFKQYEAVYVEGCLLITSFILMKLLGRHIILDTHCMNKAIALRLMPKHRLAGTARLIVWHILEFTILRSSDELIYVSDADRLFAEKHFGVANKPHRIIANEVEEAQVERFTQEAAELRQTYLSGFKKIACMIGDLGAVQNKLAADYLTQALAPATPDVHYIVLGNNPDNRPNTTNVLFTGFVEHLGPTLLAADFCIAPLETGSGTKTKVLDYMKYQKRILATPVGAEGIDASNYSDLSVLELDAWPAAINALTRGIKI
jgi:hypothetical protein